MKVKKVSFFYINITKTCHFNVTNSVIGLSKCEPCVSWKVLLENKSVNQLKSVTDRTTEVIDPRYPALVLGKCTLTSQTVHFHA